MNLIELLTAAAEKLDNYDDAGSLGMEYQSDKLRAIVTAFPQAIETVRAMQEALRKYMAAGFGNSTDFHAQGQAYDSAVEAIAKATGADNA